VTSSAQHLVQRAIGSANAHLVEMRQLFTAGPDDEQVDLRGDPWAVTHESHPIHQTQDLLRTTGALFAGGNSCAPATSTKQAMIKAANGYRIIFITLQLVNF
jgi:hypothetical protein